MAIVYPPHQCFVTAPTPVEKMMGGHFENHFIGLQKNPAGGMLAHTSEHLFPRKGLTFPEVSMHNNIMKGIFMWLLVSVGTFRPTVKWFESSLSRLNQLAARVYLSQVPSDINKCPTCQRSTLMTRSDFMHKEYYTPVCNQIWNFTFNFLYHLGISFEQAWITGRLAASVFEWEGPPYIFRLQDLIGILNLANLKKHPGRELLRVVKIYKQREQQNSAGFSVMAKFVTAIRLLSLLLLIPSIRKAFVFAAENTDIDKMNFDEGDMYYALLRSDYNYFGKSFEERKVIFTNLVKKYGLAVQFE